MTLRLPKDVEARLDLMARKLGRTKSGLAREAIVQGIEDLEDVYQVAHILHRIRTGEERTYPLEALDDLINIKP